jgi:hypothetical protein
MHGPTLVFELLMAGANSTSKVKRREQRHPGRPGSARGWIRTPVQVAVGRQDNAES